MNNNKYLVKIAQMQEEGGLQKQAFVPLIGAAVGMAARAGIGAVARGAFSGGVRSSAGRGLASISRNLAAPKGLRGSVETSMLRNHLGGGSAAGLRGSATYRSGIMNAGYNIARASNALGSSRAGKAVGSAATGVGNAASGVKGALSSPGFRRKAMTTNAVVGTAGNAMMVKELVTGAGSSASQQATQAATSAGQRAMSAVPRSSGSGWGSGGGNPGWSMHGAGAF